MKQMRKYEGLKLKLLSFEGQSYQKALETFASEFQESTGACIEIFATPYPFGWWYMDPWPRRMPPPRIPVSICFVTIESGSSSCFLTCSR